MDFFETSTFTRLLATYLDDDSYRRLQDVLAVNPLLGDLIPGSGGFRKLRWRDKRRGKGSRGGMRIIYYHFSSAHQIWLMTIYDKNEASDLSATEKKDLKAAIGAELDSRQKRNTIARRRRRV